MDLLELKETLALLTPEEVGRLLGRSWLSDRAILRHLESGNIVIDPFNRKNLGTDCYDITLGEYYWREQEPEGGIMAYNPWSEADVARIWGSSFHTAEPARRWAEKHGELENIHPDDKIIWIRPGETILCHTQEFIGGRGGIITTKMQARSSMGRNFISVCKCASKGDVGFTNRWTMEISNSSRYYSQPLVVGRRYALMLFFEVEKILDSISGYAGSGKYQSSTDMEKVKSQWSPHDMLPKLYRDREITGSK